MTKLIRGWHVYLDKYPAPDTSGGHAARAIPPERVALDDRPAPRVFGPYTIPFGSRKFALRLSDGKLLKNASAPSAAASERQHAVVTPQLAHISTQISDKPLPPIPGTIPGRSTQQRILDGYQRRAEDVQTLQPSSASDAAAPVATATAASTRLNRLSGAARDLSRRVEDASSIEERESSSPHPPSSGSEGPDGFRAALKKTSSQKARAGQSTTSRGKQLARHISRSTRAERKPLDVDGKSGQSNQQGSSARDLRSHRVPVIDSSESSDAPIEKFPVRRRKSGRDNTGGLSDLKTTNPDEYTEFLNSYSSEKATDEEIRAAKGNSEAVFGKDWAEVSVTDIEKKIGEFHDRCNKLVQTISDSDESSLKAGKDAIHLDRTFAGPTIATAIRVKIVDSDIQLNCFAHLYNLDTRLSQE